MFGPTGELFFSADSVAMFVNVTDAVFPDFSLPLFGGGGVL